MTYEELLETMVLALSWSALRDELLAGEDE